MNLPQANRASNVSQMFGGSPNVGTQQAALAANPDLPIIRGTAELVQQVGGEVLQGIDQVHQQEIAADEIAGRVELTRYLQEAEQEVQTLPTSGAAAIGHKKRTEEIYKRVDQRFEQWQSGNAQSGLRNVRHDAAKARLKLFKQEAIGRAQIRVADYTFAKQREETEKRFTLGINEAVRVADDSSEGSIAFIGQSMRDTGVDPVVVADMERNALAGVSQTRYLRAMDGLSYEMPEAETDARLNALEASLNEKEGPFRHLGEDDRREMLNHLNGTRGTLAASRRSADAEMRKAEADRQNQIDGTLYDSMVDGGLSISQVDALRKDGTITWQQHSEWVKRLDSWNNRESGGGSGGGGGGGSSTMDRRMSVGFDQAIKKVRTANDVQILQSQVEEAWVAGDISEKKYDEIRKKLDDVTLNPGARLEAMKYVSEAHFNGQDNTKEFRDKVWGFREAGIFDDSNVKDALSDAKSSISEIQKQNFGLFMQRVEKMQASNQITMGVYTGKAADFEKSKMFLNGTPGQEIFGFNSWDAVPLDEDMFANFISQMQAFSRQNPTATMLDLKTEQDRILQPGELEVAKRRMRLTAGDYDAERRRAQFRVTPSDDRLKTVTPGQRAPIYGGSY